MTNKEWLDNSIPKYTEANMYEFALDYFEKFCDSFVEDGFVDVLKADKFLSKNIKRFNNE